MPRIKGPDITILGAGPAGITAALMMGNMGIPCLLIDKDQFPRNKICGDGLSGKVISLLKRIDPVYVSELDRSDITTASHAVRFYSPGIKMMELSFNPDGIETPSGFICRRNDFDNFLLSKALAFPGTRFESGVYVGKITRMDDKVVLEDKTGNNIVESRLLLFAAGSEQSLVRQLNPAYRVSQEEGLGVRGYFSPVTGSDQNHAIEIHFLQELIPWYLWIFPFADGSANVGLAMQGNLAKKHPMSVKELLFHLIEKDPHLKNRFVDAKLIGKIEASRLPFYNGKKEVAGNHFLLLGDAANLIDPFTGEGIGNAMLSGYLAAEIAAECLAKNDFSHTVTRKYQDNLYNSLGTELDLSLKLQGLARRKQLLNLVIGRASQNKKIRDRISEMLYSMEAKRKLNDPVFYLKLLLGV